MPNRLERGVFLEKRSYRKRRLLDGLKLLPLLGAWLFLLPVFWPEGGDVQPRTTSQALIYVFAVWVGLICLSGGFLNAFRSLRNGGDGQESGEGE